MKDTNWHRSKQLPTRVRMEARRVGGCAWSMARDDAERNKTACGSEEQEPCPFPVSPGESRAGRVPPTPPNPGGSPRKRASPLARSPANDHRFFHCHKFLLDRNRPSHGSLERSDWCILGCSTVTAISNRSHERSDWCISWLLDRHCVIGAMSAAIGVLVPSHPPGAPSPTLRT